MRRTPWFAALIGLLLATPARGDVERVEIEARGPVLGGAPFGETGSYEKLTGTIHFVFDPANPANAAIVDLGLAPRNAAGLVEAHGDLMVLQPTDRSKGSGTVLLEVSNRGGKASLGYFNRARFAADPTDEAHFGDGLLMRLGLTVIWVGWQFDVPLRDDRLRLHVPIATENGEPIEGWVRSDWTVDRATDTLDLAHRNHVAYPVLDPEHPGNVLTVRDGRLAKRQVVPRESWHFAIPEGAELRPDTTHITREGGFEAGRIYELVYRAKDPAVVGLGLAAIRDTLSFAKHAEVCPFPVERGIAVGISQTGRFLRHFLYQGFNTDEQDRQVFDGMLIHTAGAGRGSFNHRFAQPSRDGHRYSAFFYPTDLFPFNGRTMIDEVTGTADGLLAKLVVRHHEPKIFYTNTGYEYWGRAASLLHTTPDGSTDVEPRGVERIYHLASGQHFVSGFPPRGNDKHASAEAWRGNPLDFLLTERALLVALQEWVEADVAPPPSGFPRLDDGTLVSIDALAFPVIPGIDAPTTIHEAYRADYGDRWRAGILDRQPPALGAAFPSGVSQVDAYGNERAGVPTVEILVPLATYTPWSLRTGQAGGAHELTDFLGNYIPLPRTRLERLSRRDGRPSIAETYAAREAYLERVDGAIRDLVARRLLLEEDGPRARTRAEQQWDWIMES